MSKEIEFIIEKNGNVKIENVCGFGPDCLKATQEIEAALGLSDESSREMTEEFNKPVEQELETRN